MRLEHLLSRALVLVDLSTRLGKKTKVQVGNKSQRFITLAVSSNNIKVKSCKVQRQKSRTFDSKTFGFRYKNKECLVAQLVRVLH